MWSKVSANFSMLVVVLMLALFLTGCNNVPVPNVVGMTRAHAEITITAAGLIVGKVTMEYSDTVPAGQVIWQAPESDTKIKRGSIVNLVVSLGADFGEGAFVLLENFGEVDANNDGLLSLDEVQEIIVGLTPEEFGDYDLNDDGFVDDEELTEIIDQESVEGEGEPSEGETVEGEGESVEGEPEEGESIEGEPTEGEPVEGEGEVVEGEGEPVEGEGEVVEGEGEVVEGEGEVVEGEGEVVEGEGEVVEGEGEAVEGEGEVVEGEGEVVEGEGEVVEGEGEVVEGEGEVAEGEGEVVEGEGEVVEGEGEVVEGEGEVVEGEGEVVEGEGEPVEGEGEVAEGEGEPVEGEGEVAEGEGEIDPCDPDIVSPEITLSGDISVVVECGDSYTDAGATATDTCDGDLTSSIAVGGDTVDTAVPGEYTITYNVSDTASNAAVEVTRTITVQDTTAPSIKLVGNASEAVECGDSYTDAGATATDTCDGDLTSSIAVGGDTVDSAVPGEYTITYNVSDTASNAAVEVTRTVTVEDTTAPGITLVGNASETVECGDSYTDAGATATDTCDGDLTSSIVIGGDTVDAAVPGEYVITYNVSDTASNAAAEVTRTVTVQDTTLPVITLVGNASETVECSGSYTDAGATATDTCDGDLTSSIVIGGDTVDAAVTGEYVITYNVSDTASNAAVEVTRTVTVQDTTLPVITLLGSTSITLDCDGTYTDAGATAVDTCDGDLTSNIVVGGDSVDTSIPGDYIITYNVTDAALNTAIEISRTVTVLDNCAESSDGWIYNPNTDHYYHTTAGLNWWDADAAAQEMGGYLCTINDAGESAWLLYSSGLLAGDGGFWTGLNDQDTEGTFVWTNGDGADYRNWGEAEPDAATDDDDCVELYGTASDLGGTWNDINGTYIRSAIVERNTIPNEDWFYNPATGHYYCLTANTLDWLSAQALSDSLGGYLTTINNADEDDWILDNLLSGSDLFWIGLNDQETEGVFVWENGETDEYRNWRDGEPNNTGGDENHVCKYGPTHTYAGQWNDDNYATLFKSVIERDTPPPAEGTEGEGEGEGELPYTGVRPGEDNPVTNPKHFTLFRDSEVMVLSSQTGTGDIEYEVATPDNVALSSWTYSASTGNYGTTEYTDGKMASASGRITDPLYDQVVHAYYRPDGQVRLRLFDNDGILAEWLSGTGAGTFADIDLVTGDLDMIVGDDGNYHDEIILFLTIDTDKSGDASALLVFDGALNLIAYTSVGTAANLAVDVGDVDGDDLLEIITTRNEGQGTNKAHLQAFRYDPEATGPTAALVAGPIRNWWSQQYGTDVAAGDFNGDGVDEVCVSMGNHFYLGVLQADADLNWTEKDTKNNYISNESETFLVAGRFLFDPEKWIWIS